mmetsp:Transcript_63354/g.151587  ORF Transcript_63354/g.151587 Transcript_63354/m.151587 type:complete len:215 (+) Transcript_63354:3-647(+)
MAQGRPSGALLWVCLGVCLAVVAANPAPAQSEADAKAELHRMAQQRKDAAVKGVVHAAPAPAPKAAGVPELHHVSDKQGPSLQGGQGKGNTGGTYGVLASVGNNLGLTNQVTGGNTGGKKAKPVAKAILNFMKSKSPSTAWSSAIFIVSCIGGTVVTLTAIGTYFIAKAENKKLKKAKKRSNLLGGRYGSVKKEDDSSDDEPPVYEPMMMTDIV